MSQKTTFPFGAMIPGLDFMQQLASGGASHAASSQQHWITPTVDVDELERRIKELKTVQFWLEQNLLGVKATVQALEVQKMTLQTLQGMNLSMGEIVKAFTLPAPDAAPAASSKPKRAEAQAKDGAESADADAQAKEKATKPKAASTLADPLQWWGALGQQFQQIAAQTLQEAAARATPPKPEAGKESAGTDKKTTAAKKAAQKKPAAAKSTRASKATAPDKGKK